MKGVAGFVAKHLVLIQLWFPLFASFTTISVSLDHTIINNASSDTWSCMDALLISSVIYVSFSMIVTYLAMHNPFSSAVLQFHTITRENRVVRVSAEWSTDILLVQVTLLTLSTGLISASAVNWHQRERSSTKLSWHKVGIDWVGSGVECPLGTLGEQIDFLGPFYLEGNSYFLEYYNFPLYSFLRWQVKKRKVRSKTTMCTGPCDHATLVILSLVATRQWQNH